MATALSDVAKLPLGDATFDTIPRPPACCTVAVQLQPPPLAALQLTDEYPNAEMMFAAPEQSVWVDEITRHDGASVNCSVPVVIVLSEYVPSAWAVQVPVTRSEPTTGALGQPAPIIDRSRLPLTVRHDEVTFQVPTTLPPHAVTFEHTAPVAPPPELAPTSPAPALPALVAPPDEPPLLEFPPTPAGVGELLLQAPEMNAAMIAVAKEVDRNFIERSAVLQLAAS